MNYHPHPSQDLLDTMLTGYVNWDTPGKQKSVTESLGQGVPTTQGEKYSPGSMTSLQRTQT